MSPVMRNRGQTIDFRVTIYIEPDGTEFHAFCPVLKGLHAGGATIDEALANCKDAVIAYLQSLMKHGDPIPLSTIEAARPAAKRIRGLLCPSTQATPYTEYIAFVSA